MPHISFLANNRERVQVLKLVLSVCRLSGENTDTAGMMMLGFSLACENKAYIENFIKPDAMSLYWISENALREL